MRSRSSFHSAWASGPGEAAGKVESHMYRVADITEGRSSNVLVLPGDVLVVEERLF